MAAPTTPRARARAEMLEQITAIAHRQLEELGAPGLNLRAIARELGVVSSAVYRYVASRDDLLTLLIIRAFDSVGEAAEAAAADASGGFASRFRRLAHAVRAWGVANPHDWALVYGSPVPGYRAPQDTVASAQRVTAAAIAIVADGLVAGEVAPGPPRQAPGPVHRDFETMRAAFGPAFGDDLVSRVLLVWTGLFGHIGYELYGHLHQAVTDYDAFFDHQLDRWLAVLTDG